MFPGPHPFEPAAHLLMLWLLLLRSSPCPCPELTFKNFLQNGRDVNKKYFKNLKIRNI